jgi:beta-mannosidase
LVSALPTVESRPIAEGDVLIEISSEEFLHAVRLVAPGFRPEENYFHLLPGSPRTVRFQRIVADARFAGTLEALNLGKAYPLPDPSTPQHAHKDRGQRG